jgi:hypothetical protein
LVDGNAGFGDLVNE